MPWSVHLPERVGKRIRKFPRRDSMRIVEVMRSFEVDPWWGNIVKIKGYDNLWRKRVGNYRIFYSVKTETKTVEIKEIERRGSKTY